MLKIASNHIIINIDSDITNGIFLVVREANDVYMIAKRIQGHQGEGSLLGILEKYMKDYSSITYKVEAHIIRYSSVKRRCEIIY